VPEIIYAQAARTFLAEEGSRQKSLAGFSDPAIAGVLKAIHESPGNQWTLEKSSQVAGYYRTVFPPKSAAQITSIRASNC